MFPFLSFSLSFPFSSQLQVERVSGLSPFWTVVIILLIVLVLWWLLSYQSSREDLHQAPAHDHDDHGDHAHDAHQHEAAAQTTEAAAAETASPEPAPAPSQPDDLKKLEGIGPKVASLLNQAGILTFAQLAETPVSRLQDILEGAGYQYMDPASWPQQAALAAAGDWEALHKLQDELSGGRHAG